MDNSNLINNSIIKNENTEVKSDDIIKNNKDENIINNSGQNNNIINADQKENNIDEINTDSNNNEINNINNVENIPAPQKGLDAEQIAALRAPNQAEMDGIKSLSSAFPNSILNHTFYNRFVNDDGVRKLDSQDPRFKAIFGGDEPDYLDPYIDSTGNSKNLLGVTEEELNTYRSGLQNTANQIDSIFSDYARENPNELKESGLNFLKSLSSKKLKRIADGYPLNYILYKSPLGETVLSLAACINVQLENGKLQKNIDKWADKFPLYDYVNAAEDQTDILVNYWKEKEANNGTITKEREEFYRHQLYNKTIDVIIPFQKMMSAVENKTTHDQIKKDGVFAPGNDPFHIHPASGRGLRTASASLEAYKKGLEQGWGIDDLAILASFRSIIESFEYYSLGNNAITFDAYQKHQNGPQYANDDVKQYVERLRQTYDEILSTPLSNPEDRNAKLKAMYDIIQEGKNNKYLMLDSYTNLGLDKYFEQLYTQRTSRDQLIEQGRMSATFDKIDPVNKLSSVITPEKKKEKLDSILTLINSRRTDKWWSSESNLHNKLTQSIKTLSKKIAEYNTKFLNKQNNFKEADKKKAFLTYGYNLLNALDEVSYYSSRYASKRGKASTLGGIARLTGAGRMQDFVNEEKKNLLKQAKVLGIKVKNIDSLREKMTKQHINMSMKELSNFKGTPKNYDDRKKLEILSANILLDRFIQKNQLNGNKIVQGRGFESLKKKLLKNPEFKKQMELYMNIDSFTGKSFCGVLSKSTEIMDRIPSFDKEMKSIAKNIPQNSVKETPKIVSHKNILK